MIKKGKSVYNLLPYLDSVLQDTFGEYFNVYDLSSTLAIGKNFFRLKALKGALKQNSPVLIDIRDSEGNPIYFEVLNTKGEDGSRIISIHVEVNTPPGNCIIMIAGHSNRSIGSIDVMWHRIATIATNSTTNSPILYTRPPIVEIAESRAVYRKLVSTNSRRVNIANTSTTISLKTPQLPTEFTRQEKFLTQDTEYTNLKKLDSKSQVKTLITPGRSESVTFGKTNESAKLPANIPLPVISTSSPFFSKSMEGGEVLINNVVVSHLKPADVTSNSPFTVLAFSASIIEVVSDTVAYIDRPFYKKVEYVNNAGQKRVVVLDSFINHSNFTASYVDKPNLQVTSASESFASVDIKRLSPSAGLVDKIHIKFRPIGSFGEYVDVGEFRITQQNLLSDRLTYKLTDSEGYTEKPIGQIETTADLSNYWSSYVVGGGSINLSRNTTRVEQGFRVNYTPPIGEPANAYGVVQTYSRYYFECAKDTEYLIELDYYARSTSTAIPQLDVYVSGSRIDSGVVNRTKMLTPNSSLALGTFVDSITSQKGGEGKFKTSFKAHSDGNLILNLAIRSGQWHLGNISISPIVQAGYTPNHIRLGIPTSRFEVNSELSVLVEYYNKNNVKSTTESKVYGVYFTGSFKPDISGSLYDTGSFVTKTSFNDYTSSAALTFVKNSQSSSFYNWNNFTNIPNNLLSGSQQIANDISGSFEQTALTLAAATSLLSSSLEARILPLEQPTFAGTTVTYIGNLQGISTRPKLLSMFSMPTSASIEKAFVFVSSSASWNKVTFYFTTGSLDEVYDPRSSGTEYNQANRFGIITLSSGGSLFNYTSSVVNSPGWPSVGRTTLEYIRIFASSSGANIPDDNTRTTIGLVLRKA